MNVNGFEVKHFPGKHRALDINMHHAKYAHRLNGSEVTVCDSSSECELKKEPDYEFAHPSDLSWPVSRSKHLHDGFDVNGSRVSTMTPADYLASVNHGTLLHDYITSRPSSSATSLRSTTLPDIPSRNSSRFSRHSARGKKRGLSISPSTELTIDLNEIIRTSPNSLVAFINGGGITHGWQSRGSSAASRGSGSYGHLSAASISPSPFQSRAGSSHSMSQSSLFSHRSRPFNVIPKPPSEMPGTMPSSVFKNPAKTSTSLELPPTQTPHVSSSTDDQIVGKQYGWSPAFKEAASNSKQPQVSFDDGISALKHEEVMDESISNSCAEATPMSSIGEYESDEEECEKDEFDLTCRWAKCGIAFENQTSLVHHVNAEHIQKNKKSCSCYWAGCTRESKPFKAMYMLVVHVRRHTGEKPHKCHFEGCNKAYSRLENLKTHVRSHTGERPYVCEFEGCQKAFSNASDRAKHQNRTHSSVKQYGCKVEGCPKRYTDPSSLRKHMKTVHGTIPQPTKKIKGSPSRDFAPEQPASSNASQESEQEQRRQSVAQCLVVKPYSTVADSRGDGPSNAGRVASSASTSAFAMSAALSPNAREYGRPRLGSGSNWSPHLVLGSPLSARVDELNGPDDDALASPGVYLDVQPRLVLPQISKKVNIGASLALSPQAQLSPPSSTKLLNRRDSNTSVTSIDSGAESYSSSRRCSDISLLSYLSSRRSSQASMMASRLSPRNIATQTLIEDQVLEHIPSEDMSHCDATAIASDSCHPSVNNQLSRVSSGYGSQSNYFRAKSPSVNSHDPEFPREIRRASDGNLKRVSDSGFKPTPLPVQFDRHLRRGSEPVSTVQVIDNTPRRKSYSAFDPLPLPASMTRDRPNWNVQTQQAPGLNTFTRPIEEAVGNPAWSTTESAALQQQASRVINASDALQSSGMPRSNLVVKHQEDSLVELLSSPEGMDVQDFRVRGSPKSGVVLACADSTMADPCADHLVDDPLSRFVENLVHSEAPGLQGAHLSHGGPPNYSLANQARFEQQKQQWVLQQRHQVQQGGSHMIGSSPYQTPSNYAFTTAGERNRSFANAQLQSNRLPSFHSQLTQSGGRLPQQQQQQLRPQPPYMGSRGNGTFNQDNRFQSVAVNYEPDSTLEAAEAKQMEDLMVQSLHGLSTKPVDSYMRPPTNMVLNNMNTLLQSLAEENKYFESQALLHDGRYP